MHIDLTQGDIAKHIRTLAIPASVGFFFHTMFNVTDTYFAGQISTQALAALSLSFPIFFMIIAIAGGMAEAVTAAVGNALGGEESAEAQHIAHNALLLALILSIALTLVGYLIAPILMHSLGATGSYFTMAVSYINVIVFGTFLFVTSFFINALLNAVGDTVSFRNILIVSALLNVVLDYWFLHGGLGIKPMQVESIALATVIIEAITALYLLYRLGRTPFFYDRCPFRVDGEVIMKLLSQGLPPSTNMVLMAAGIYIITYFAAPFGKEVVAAYGIGMRIEQIILMPAIGLNVAVLAIVAQNSGAGHYDRIAETLEKALSYGMLLALAGGFILMGAAEFFMTLFSDSKGVIAEGIVYLRIEALIIYPFVMIFTCLALLQGVQKPAFIFYLSLVRQVIAPVIVLGLLALLGFGVIAIWVAIAVIVTLSALATFWYAHEALEKLKASAPTPHHPKRPY